MSLHILRQASISQVLCRTIATRAPRHLLSFSRLAPLESSVDAHDSNPIATSSQVSSLAESTLPADSSSVQRPAEADPHARPPDGPNREALKQKRKGKKPSPSEPPPPSQPSRVETYLAAINAAGLQPTLADLERCRPINHAHPDSRKYPSEYNTLMDTLCRSFSREQLRGFLRQWDADGVWHRAKQQKIQYAETVIEKMWKWPSLKEVERDKRDHTEVSVKSIPMTASQLFLILGKDGVDLLRMSRAFNVHMSLTTKPLTLRVEGLRAPLQKLSDRIKSIKHNIVVDTFQLPTRTSIPPDMVQRISRQAGAFLENVDSKGTIRIFARDARGAEVAKRLASRSVHEINRLSQSLKLAYIPLATSGLPMPTSLAPQAYSLYPFLSPRSAPWNIAVGGTFRVRRVGEWLGREPGENIHVTGGLAGEKGQIITTTQQAVDLRDGLLHPPNLRATADSAVPRRRTVKASMGHVLLSATSKADRPRLVPPLKGPQTLARVLKWIADSGVQSSFLPSLPATLLEKSPTHQRLLHRLVYHAISTNEGGESRQHPTYFASAEKLLQLELLLAERHVGDPTSANTSGDADLSSSGEEDEPHAPHTLDWSTRSQCWISTESQIDLMMPDRSMDMKLSSIDSDPILSGREPQELRSYMSSLQTFLSDSIPGATQPDPPLMIRHAGETFILHTVASVKQSVEPIDGSERAIPAARPTGADIRIVSESILDLESHQKLTQCEIILDDHDTSTDAWKRFLTECDKLSSVTNRTSMTRIEESHHSNEQ